VPICELEALDKRYGTIHAIKNVTATIDGDCIGLLGVNGAGKSTLLKCLLGLVPHTGRATVLGFDAAKESLEIRRRVGYMPESDMYLAGMTAVELCTYAAELSGLPRTAALQRAHAALYYAGLEDKRYQVVDGYSTGLKQRVKLAQALVHDPDLLFLDEPTNGLDPAAREEMLELIHELPDRRGSKVIVSTHLLPDVDRICDTVVVLAAGTIRFSGSIEKLRQQTGAGVYDVEVKSNAAAFAQALQNAACQVSVKNDFSLTVTLPDKADTSHLFSIAKSSGAQIRGLEQERESLEQAFLRVVA
jgi:ABC-2 type transport system ATP-binding protein